MKKYFSYIRVSTPKQGEGVSLEVQEADNQRVAERLGVEIIEKLVEKETAAKTDRTVFTRMLRRLERREADGVIIHKIDRSARNLWDWACLSKLYDLGVDVQFSHDHVDLNNRGGRLSADIIAIVAADYIRNLREEVKKGFYGRLKQGFYPLPAPIGYLDEGKGKAKSIDPERAAHVQHAFARYASATVGLKALRLEMERRGLRTRKGKPISLQSLHQMLRSPFYIGIIRISRTGEVFEGIHPPLIRKSTFDRVQQVLQGKAVPRIVAHDFAFRRFVRCERCGLNLIGERQKGHAYYRCHSEQCRGTSTREELLDDLVQKNLKLLIGNESELREVRDMVEVEKRTVDQRLETERTALKIALAGCEDRLARLTDALVDQLIDKTTFSSRNVKLLSEKRELQERIAMLSAEDLPNHQALANLELGNVAYSGYISADPRERGQILRSVTSNLTIDGKKLGIALLSPYREIVEWRQLQNGAPYTDAPRVRAKKLLAIITTVNSRLNLTSSAQSRSSVLLENVAMSDDNIPKIPKVPRRIGQPVLTRRDKKAASSEGRAPMRLQNEIGGQPQA